MIIKEGELILPPEDSPPQCEGGFGIVYKGGHHGRTVAIKVMRLFHNRNLDVYLSVSAPLHTPHN